MNWAQQVGWNVPPCLAQGHFKGTSVDVAARPPRRLMAKQDLDRKEVHAHAGSGKARRDPLVVVFEARPPAIWSLDDQKLAKHHTKAWGLVVAFATNANDELSTFRNVLIPLGVAGAQAAARDHLETQLVVNQDRLNSWKYATYRTLAGDASFVGGGYLRIL